MLCRASGWDELLAEARQDSICDGAVQWLLENGDVQVQPRGWAPPREHGRLQGYDAGMLRLLFEQVLPGPDQIDAPTERLRSTGATTAGQGHLCRLSERVLPRSPSG